MKKKKQKKIIPGESRILRFELFHNGLYKQKIIRNKKKDNKKFNLQKELSPYLSILSVESI